MGRPPNGKTTTINGKTSGLRVSKTASVKGPATLSKGGSPTNSGIGKAQSDRSQLNFPYDIRLSGFTSIQNAVTKGTPKIRRILTEECDYIMECRICRNLFRSLPNFITHKLNYCKKVFDSTWCIGLSNLVQTSDRMFNIEYEVDPELLIDESVSNNDEKTRSTAEMYEELATKSQAQRNSSAFEQTLSTSENLVRLKIKPLVDGPGGSVVLQQRTSCDPSNCDVTSSCSQPIETVARDTAILGPDGKIMCTGSSKGIEEVVSRLSSKLRALEEKQVLSTSPGTSISCEVCKTVFDTEKSLRQHKREGLDCGRTWGSKSPIKNNQSSHMKASSESILIPAKRFKNDVSGLHSSLPVNNRITGSTEGAADSAKFKKCAAPVQARRYSHKAKAIPSPSKRGLPLSPVKKIKMKYSKLDSSSPNFVDDKSKVRTGYLSCNNCSSSFNTKHEMSMHLALCNGVINYAFLGECEPRKEKIRISIRNEFNKSTPASITKVNDGVGEGMSKPDRELILTKTAIQSVDLPSKIHSLTSDTSRDVGRPSVWKTGALQTQEVNNNKQYHYPNCETNEQKEEINEVSLLEVKETNSNTNVENPSELGHSAIPSTDGGPCKSSVDADVETGKGKDSVNASSTSVELSPTTKSRKSKPSKVSVVAQVVTRLEKRHSKCQKGFNLRRAVRTRVRKSGRISGSPFYRRK